MGWGKPGDEETLDEQIANLKRKIQGLQGEQSILDNFHNTFSKFNDESTVKGINEEKKSLDNTIIELKERLSKLKEPETSKEIKRDITEGVGISENIVVKKDVSVDAILKLVEDVDKAKENNLKTIKELQEKSIEGIDKLQTQLDDSHRQNTKYSILALVGGVSLGFVGSVIASLITTPKLPEVIFTNGTVIFP